MTGTHFQIAMEQIKEDLLQMGGMVEDALDEALRALNNHDSELAKKIIIDDHKINQMENKIDEQAVRVIATQQPVAIDLRFLTSAMKMCTILERTADQAVNLAERTLILKDLPEMEEVPPALMEMAEVAKEMTRKCLDAFVKRDVKLAYDVCCQDDELDALNRKLLEEILNWMMEEKRLIRRGVELILAARHLERIGDQATNVAEEVVFIVEGRVVRHTEFCGPRGQPKDQ